MQTKSDKRSDILKNSGKTLLMFGAGKIGRSFIGQIFSRSGYEVVFVDINGKTIEQLNKRHNYQVVIKAEKEQVLEINNVRGVLATNEEKVITEIADADIMAVSVGKNGLPSIIGIIAKGLELRYKKKPTSPIDIILAENMHNADQYVRQELLKKLPFVYPLDDLVGLVETSIGKMVPIMESTVQEKDPLLVYAEPYNTLILDKNGFKNPIPDVPELAPKDNMKAWVDRKIFIHNLGHAVTSYYGYTRNPNAIYIYELLADADIYRFVREAMLQSAHILQQLYPDAFTNEQLEEHIDDLLFRFQNKALKDTVFRVGSDLMRKLGSDDRIVRPIKEALLSNLPYDKLLYALVCASKFSAKDEAGKLFPGDKGFIKRYNSDIVKIMSELCRFDPIKHKTLFTQASDYLISLDIPNSILP